MCGIAGYFQDVIGTNFSAYPAATVIVVGLSAIGFTHFVLSFLSYFNMLGDLFVRPPTNVRKSSLRYHCFLEDKLVKIPY